MHICQMATFMYVTKKLHVVNNKSGISIEWVDGVKEKIIPAFLKNGKEGFIHLLQEGYCNREFNSKYSKDDWEFVA